MRIILDKFLDDFQTYQKQEWTPSDISDGFRPQFQEVSQPLNHAARAIALALMESSSPFIWQTSDRMGNIWWIIDDSLSGNRFQALSEEEVSAWLAQHHYAKPNSSQSISSDVDFIIKKNLVYNKQKGRGNTNSV
ncbi:hypothetical protein IQ244_06730 [Nostoc sp. LEGE 06077]|uniref:hypothetical protein n=1 Tax=Nostoc sp. LEGE 06077 TaxID=915325 RepID=UPI000B5FBD37|nr:hypothetical protein [Nostoc sp. LEGE 06077]MBE9206211.1 hypothetical protein [Nostoc sp. LEGE 06077]BAZ19143.1 hypothetical protein NIES4073_00130 [Scytonema sp. NIES-4073]